YSTTRSTSGISLSACQTIVGFSPVTCSSATAASRSQLDAGKITTADFKSLFPYPLSGQRHAGRRHLSLVGLKRYFVLLDHGVGEQPLAHFFEARTRFRLIALVQIDIDHLALAYFTDRAETEVVQRVADRLSLRIKNAIFQRNEDARFHGRLLV